MKASEMNQNESIITLICIDILQSIQTGDQEKISNDIQRLSAINQGCRKLDLKSLDMIYMIVTSATNDDLLDGEDTDPDMSNIGNCLKTLMSIYQ